MKTRTRTVRLLLLTAALGLAASSAFAVDTLYDQRFKQWTEEADKGDAIAQYNLANAYLRGNEVDRDVDKALGYLHKAAAQEYAKAQYKLGYLYYTGKGVKRDYNKAFSLFEKAAKQDYSPAQYYLGECYLEGRGVNHDSHRALYWVKQASTDNYYGAKQEMAKIQAMIQAERDAAKAAEAKAQAEIQAEAKAERAAEKSAQAEAALARQAEQSAQIAKAQRDEAKQSVDKSAKASEPKARHTVAKAAKPHARQPSKREHRESARVAKVKAKPAAHAQRVAATKVESGPRALLLAGHWLNEGGVAAKHMPSDISHCTATEQSIVCRSGTLKRSNLFAEVTYMVEAKFGRFSKNGQFMGSYRSKVLSVRADDPTNKNPSEEDVPTPGWKPRTVLRCKFKDDNNIECVNDNFAQERYTRETTTAKAVTTR